MSISIQERYFSLNRILLLTVGLWPYQQSKFVSCQAALCLGILTSFVILLLSRLCFLEYSFDFTIHLLSASTYFAFILMNYISFWINIETIQYLLEQFQYIYNRLKDSKEIAIYNKYGNIGKRITISITVGICNHAYLAVIQCGPYILDMIMPKNETYSRRFILVMSNYFAVQEKYFYLFLLHLNAVFAVGSLALIAVATMLLSCLKHICGMMKIASYRFEQAILTMLQSITLKNKTMTYKEFICAVDIHRKAMEIAKIFVDDMERSLFIVTMSTVLCMSLNLYALSQGESPVQEIERTIGHLLLIIFLFTYMFIANYAGQEITDSNNHIFLTVYNASWYLAPLQIQKLILFLLQRSNKAFTLNLGGLFTLSIECFASLINASVSYFTLMLSL
ncbi:uncharacterized protein LOC105278029 isoform X2 [Ooceraea biroi]|uniref:uncharacterized protein LOC105278029 isoform X2 n=1 Tax=Ooceraea biroi TaxID=2015173 RepID=UPI000F09A0FB|nr:uncharacterized protein LOC105278029 isoform X2 [Ooceraea biroi]